MADADSSTSTRSTDAAARIAALEAALNERDTRIAELLRERDELRAAYDRLWLEVELMRRRIFIAKAERVDTTQLELEFKDKLAALDKLAGTLGIGPASDAADGKNGGSRPKPKGRRDLRQIKMPEERVEIPDPAVEVLVAQGQAERIGFEESAKIAWQRGGPRRLVLARVKYRVPDANNPSPETTQIATAPVPPEIFPRAIASVSLVAHVLVDKYCDGLPFHRQEHRFARLGLPLDRGTMCRWAEHAGATLGATVVAAMRADAMKTAFCISTDATGVLVQPARDPQRRRQPCRRGHYFVQIADRDHVFFEYTPRETSAAVGEMFKGFSGYVQADAKSVYDILFKPPPEDPLDGGGDADRAECTEVGCLSHARRRYWEATIAKSAVAREGLARLGRVFALERKWKRHPPVERTALRQAHARPHLEAFFDWAEEQFALVKDQRGLLRSALGYSVRNKAALMRYLDDGRLEPTNNGSERALRTIAVGRNAWIFVGSDDHAESAGHLFSLIASARLHALDPEAYLRDLLRVLPHWPRDRFLELAPKFWPRTRDRLDSIELAADLGSLTVPPTINPPAEQKPSAQS
ncbi:MAG: IS66 family transposase [Burkholderiales bacterium]